MVVPTAFLYLIPRKRREWDRRDWMKGEGTTKAQRIFLFSLYSTESALNMKTHHCRHRVLMCVRTHINPFSMDKKDVICIIFVRFHSHFILSLVFPFFSLFHSTLFHSVLYMFCIFFIVRTVYSLILLIPNWIFAFDYFSFVESENVQNKKTNEQQQQTTTTTTKKSSLKQITD